MSESPITVISISTHMNNLIMTVFFGVVFLFLAFKFYDAMEKAQRDHIISKIKFNILFIIQNSAGRNAELIRLYNEIEDLMLRYRIHVVDLKPYILSEIRKMAEKSHRDFIGHLESELKSCTQEIEECSPVDSGAKAERKASLQAMQGLLQEQLKLMEAELTSFHR